VTQEQLVALARQVDAARAAEKAEKERIEDGRAAAIAAGDAVIKKAEEYQSALAKLLAGGPAAQLEQQRREMQLLADAFNAGTITAEQFSDAATGALGLMGDKLAETKSIADELGMSFASAFEDAIVGGKEFGEVLKALEQDIIRIITRRLVTEPFSQWVSGQVGNLTGGGGIGDLFGNLFKSFGGLFAEGGTLGAGKWGIAGEAGPELVMGPAQILPAGAGATMTVQNHFTITGPVDRRTQEQIAAAAGRGVQRAMTRNG
jgi:hypothetical protein